MVSITNSSASRVVPVLSALFTRDPTGASWVRELMALGSWAAAARFDTMSNRLMPNHRATWGRHELALPAPLVLLEHLVRTITPEQVKAANDDPSVSEKRSGLARKEVPIVDEAVGLLRRGRRGKKWWVLEGPSKPDATLVMPDDVLVLEGKRLEDGCTANTKWMPQRSQLLRHMDAAMEAYPRRRVLGLLIVEGDGGATAYTPSTFWQN